MTSRMIIRIDPELKKRFSTLAKTERKPAKDLIRLGGRDLIRLGGREVEKPESSRR